MKIKRWISLLFVFLLLLPLDALAADSGEENLGAKIDACKKSA